ncbi:MAG: phosphatidylinositol transfer protein [Deltaproteobacteria bacterium]|nr:phosphatidylinositol transfer protein [Deltaproteobacteria bacterium]
MVRRPRFGVELTALGAATGLGLLPALALCAAGCGARGTGAVVRGDAACPPPTTCDAPPPDPGPVIAWRHPVRSALTAGLGAPRHRGRDLVLREGEPQWALAKFAYGLADDDLQGEDVAMFLLRGCGDTWEELGTATATDDGEHATVERVDDTGGRVYFELPEGKRLGVGRHRVRFVVRGDRTTAEQLIDVLPADARFVVTDVDGTLTAGEAAEFAALLGGRDPAANPAAAEVLRAYAGRGYHVMYLTARPEWLAARTHEWLRGHGFPPGTVRTTLTITGAVGEAAAAYKAAELAALLGRFPDSIEAAYGNTESDVAAYASAGLPPDRVFSYRHDPEKRGTRVDDYGTLLPAVEALAACARQ